MAVRRVSVRVAIDGEAEYKRAINSLKQETSIYKNELKGVDEAYKNNKDSMEYLEKRGSALGKVWKQQSEEARKIHEALENARKAQADYAQKVKEAEEQVKKASDALEKYKESGEGSDEETKKLSEALDDANGNLDKQKALLDAATRGVDNWRLQESKINAELKNTESAIEQNNKALDEFPGKTKNAGNAMENLAEVLVANQLASGIKEVTGALNDCVDAAISFESSFADVIKTVDGTEEQMAQLKDDILTMSTRLPFSAEQISEIASLGGQLGVATEDISMFTEVMLGLGSATNLTADDAATMIAQFSNITGLKPDLYEAFASALVHLGNNSATTERNIMEMSQRIASTGAVVGLSETDILGLSTALSSVGISAEAGGTSMSKLMSNISSALSSGGKELEKYAKIAGMSSEEFKKLGDQSMMDALNAFIKGIDDSEDSLKALADADINDVRMRQAILSLANSEKDLAYYTDMASQAFKDNTALAEEVSKKNETSASKNEILKNSFNNLKIAIGEQLQPVMDSFRGKMTEVVGKITDWVKQNPALVKAIGSVVSVMGAVVTGVVGVTGALKVLNVVMTTIEAHPTVAIITGIIAAVSALIPLISNLAEENAIYVRGQQDFAEVATSTKGLIEELNEAYAETALQTGATQEKADEYLKKLEELEGQGDLTAEQQEEYNKLVEALKILYPELDLVIDENTGKIKGGTDAIREQIDAINEKIMIAAMEDTLTELYKNQLALEKEQADVLGNIASQKDVVRKKEEEYNKVLAEYNDEVKKASEMGEQYTGNLDELADKASRLGDELKGEQDKLFDMSKGYGDNTKAIKDNNAEIDSYLERITKIKSGEKEVQDVIAETTKSYDKETEAYQAGSDTADGYINGITNKKRKFVSTVHDFAKAGLDEYARTFNIHSPSRVARQQSSFVGEGYVLGIKDKAKQFSTALKDMAIQGIKSFEDAAAMADNSLYNGGEMQITAVANLDNAPKGEQNNTYTLNVYPQSMSESEQESLLNKFDRLIGDRVEA